jgi:hypothetical protein
MLAACSKSLWGMVSLIPVGKKQKHKQVNNEHVTKWVNNGYVHNKIQKAFFSFPVFLSYQNETLRKCIFKKV